MKKSIILIGSVLCLISVSAITISNLQNSKTTVKSEKAYKLEPQAINSSNFLALAKVTTVDDIDYDFNTRFEHTVTLNQVKNAKSIEDLIPMEVAKKLESYSKNKLGLISFLGTQELIGNGKKFDEQQLALLNQANYSNNLYVRSDSKTKDENGELHFYDLVYYMTVTPEKQASYKAGKEKLIEEMKELTKAHITQMKKNEIRPGRLIFTIDKTGNISNVEIENSCGYAAVDKAFKNALSTIKGEWTPAQNKAGNAIDQTLTFFYGIYGC